jgi:hypothetical protein
MGYAFVGKVMTKTESRIVQNVWRFDPISLLMLLTYLGYGLNDILLFSHFSSVSQSRLIEAIEFCKMPRKIKITLNLGLLSGQSILPDYFFKLVANNTIDAQRFVEFFGYFDDRVLRRLIFAIYPEFDETIFQNWEDRKITSLFTMRLDSIISLHWLMQLVFPDLQVRVEKTTLYRTIDLGAPIIGKSKLGYQAVLGKIKKLPVLGKRITLITDEDEFKKYEPWPVEIEKRLREIIFPILQPVDVYLEIWVVIRSQGNWLSLQENSYLGYENIVSNNLQFRKILIFSGHVS